MSNYAFGRNRSIACIKEAAFVGVMGEKKLSPPVFLTKGRKPAVKK
jgi:hypothetical protein